MDRLNISSTTLEKYLMQLHLELPADSEEFFTKQLYANFSFKEFILSILLQHEYRVRSQKLQLVTLKIEESIHYYSLLSSYYYLYGEFFNPKLKNSSQFEQLILNFEKDFFNFF